MWLTCTRTDTVPEVPVRVTFRLLVMPAVVEIAGGGERGCGRTAGGEVWCWRSRRWEAIVAGEQSTAVLAAIDDRLVPVRVEGIDDAVQIAASRTHACALRRSGEVWCWGNNDYGQLGDGTVTSRETAAPVLWPDEADAGGVNGDAGGGLDASDAARD